MSYLFRIFMKTCSYCKTEKEETEFFWKDKAHTKRQVRCKQCHRDMMRERAHRTFAWLYGVVGNKCKACGYDKCQAALELHHRNPEEKDFQISKAQSYNKDRLLREAAKCVLLCANCHREVHNGVRDISGL